MDGIKLEKWRLSFEKEVKALQIEYDAFLLPKKLQDTYKLMTDNTTQTLSLWIDSELPTEIKDRLTGLLIKTEPEDSI
jgi:hypothetical protein